MQTPPKDEGECKYLTPLISSSTSVHTNTRATHTHRTHPHAARLALLGQASAANLQQNGQIEYALIQRYTEINRHTFQFCFSVAERLPKAPGGHWCLECIVSHVLDDDFFFFFFPQKKRTCFCLAVKISEGAFPLTLKLRKLKPGTENAPKLKLARGGVLRNSKKTIRQTCNGSTLNLKVA